MNGSAWDEVLPAVQAAPYPVELVAPDPDRAEGCLTALGITRRSWLGAVVAHTGGICVDHGWLRVLGSGGSGLPDIAAQADPASRWLVVGHDVLGGQFAWVPAEPGVPPTVHYFGPDDLGWLDLEQGYADWLYAVLAGSLTQFYDTLRWPGWETEVASLGLDEGIHTWPPPSTVEGKDLFKASRKAVPMAELVSFHHEMARQLG
ncbi:DUF2625 domain-containing protein [Actinomadura viridis]|uniref:DUF2625 domain-containing protein n=1 Tax=Actinomadura viridis TaxID=58110 RepID=A0A931DGB7_9ACTN|nr:DUF2625 family protein [Actinomadura viridis]MBG6086355.1 hypothetical protein [Actinomadura viridis]